MSLSTCRLIAVCCLGLGALVVSASAEDSPVGWPGFRGPSARGVAEGHELPLVWNVGESKNVRWKTPIPGLGHSSPVIWGDRIFVTTAISGVDDPELKVGLYGNIASVDDTTVHRYEVHALDRRSGERLWKRTAHEGVPKIKRHTKATHANSTPATDGKRLIVNFGAEGLYAYGMDGKLLWKKDLGLLDSGYFMVPEAQWGFGSSPVIHDGRVLVQVDVQKDSFLAAYDVENGEQIWRTARDEVPTWGSPTVHESGGRSQVIVNGWKHLGGYDLKSGKELWRMKGGGDIPIPTPYVAHDLIFLTSAHGGGMPVYAIRTTASGDISLAEDQTANQHIAWSDPRGGSYMPTSLVYGDELYILRDNGILSCLDARSGKLHYKERVGGGSHSFTASLVAGDGKIYLTSESGEILVVRAGTAFHLLATNPMDEVCMATPAIADGTLYFRTQSRLVAIGATGP